MRGLIAGSVSFLAVVLSMMATAEAQTEEETLKVYSEHPRLFLRPARLRLLRREKERQSARWEQFRTLMAGKAQMPEPGFALALYYQISGENEAGRQAVAWALGPQNTDLRQLAIVFDWCQEAMTEAQRKSLSTKLARAMETLQRDASIPATRSRTLAAVVLADHISEISTRYLAPVVRDWWRNQIAKPLKEGHNVVPREDLYALFELLHAIRDNLNIDLRDPVPGFFKGLPSFDLLSYYPATYPAADGEYRIPAAKAAAEPDLRRAALSRAAELCMVGYDTNAAENQLLQGWLMHDNFILRGPFGSPYEFLWANPYQPGLSYYHLPLLFHDDMFGRLFVRSSWDETATWLGYFDGEMQLFKEGKVTVLNPRISSGPIALDEAVVFFGQPATKFDVTVKAEEEVFVVALKPRQAYEIEVDDEEMREQHSDPGGILSLDLPSGVKVGVRLREVQRPK